MHPVLFSIGDFRVPSYGPVYLTAFLAAVGVWALLTSRNTGLRFRQLFEVGFQVAIAGEIGARATFLIVEWEQLLAGAISLQRFMVSGRVVLGGVVTGTLAAVYMFRKHRLPVLRTLDAAGVGVSLGMAIGRFGCLLAGCCYGHPTDRAWGITFTDPLARQLNGTPLGAPLAPTQPVLMLTGFLVFGLLLWMHERWRLRAGEVFTAFFALSGLTRFGLEFLRGDPRGGGLGLATSQWIGLAMAAGAIALWVALRWGSVRQGAARRSAGLSTG